MSRTERILTEASFDEEEGSFFDYLESLVDSEHLLPAAAVLNVLRAASLLSKRLEQQLLEVGLSIPKFNVLRVLVHPEPGRDPKDGLLMKQIARRLIVSEQNVTALIDGLEARGLVRRQSCPGDRRATIVRATPEGKRLIQKVMPVQITRATQLLHSLSQQQQENLVEALTALRVSLMTPGECESQ